jgi:hypothetical protein
MVEAKDFSCILYVQSISEGHPASNSMGIWSHFPEVRGSHGLTLAIYTIYCRIQQLVGALLFPLSPG